MFDKFSTEHCSRRSVIAGLGAACGAALLHSPAQAAEAASAISALKRADFYDANGAFLTDKAGEAYFALLEQMHYPVTPTVRKNIWIADFGIGDFPRVGMGGLVWINRPDYNYFGLDILLLPGQMIPEHRHVATDKAQPKMESWQVRCGKIVTFGEGAPTPELLTQVPESQRASIQSKHGAPLGLHETGHLNRVDAWHYMIAGPQGAWVTEYGMFQDVAALRFSNPKGKV